MPNLIVISKTKLKSKCLEQLKGYTFIQNDSITNAGGVGLFIKNTLHYSYANKNYLNVSGCEEIWININFNQSVKGELKSKTVFSEMALKVTLSSILTAEIINHF